VDSTVIATLAQRFTADFTCYTVGVEGAKDLEAAAAVARKLHFSHHITVITEAAVEALLKRALAVIPEKDVVNAEVAVTALAAVELARQHGDTVLFSGLGSEEIFAGYRRHAEAKNVNEACWNGLVNMWRRDLLRDAALAEVTATTMLTPFLDKSLITTAMQVPGAWKISGSGKKIILREVATQLGVPADFAYRKKLAAQYGSSVSKAVRKLARKAGFSYKKDYLAALSQQVLQV
jgi:asparagine synthetase B (glutamine-hydrolysing)